MEKQRKSPSRRPPGDLMVLDEFAGLKRMEVIEHAVAQIAGYGVKMFFVLQSLEQLKALYKDNWETFLANSGLKVFFNLEDHFSREYVSKLIGETEVIREVHSANDSVSESESISRSTSRSKSKTTGRSSSTGTSESEGTNSSVSTGKSWGENTSEGRNWGKSAGRNWDYTGFLGGPRWISGNAGYERGALLESRRTVERLERGPVRTVCRTAHRARHGRHVRKAGTRKASAKPKGSTHGTARSRARPDRARRSRSAPSSPPTRSARSLRASTTRNASPHPGHMRWRC